MMHEIETPSSTETRKFAWRSVVVPAIWSILACVPLSILIFMQRQAEQELLAVRASGVVEQKHLAEVQENESLAKELAVELERLKPKVQKLFSAFSLVTEMPSIESPLPVIHSQGDNCWIWVPSGGQYLELYSGITNDPTNIIQPQNHFSTLMKTASFRMPSPGWYRLRYDYDWATDSESELKVEFKDFQRDETTLVPLGLSKIFGSGSYSSNNEPIYWPNQIPINLVRNTGQHITNSRLVAEPTPLLKKLSFSSNEQTLYCCIKLSINLQQGDSASNEQPYQGDYQQLERAIIESHRFMR
ncbi:MAG: hypothetical protein U0930_15795 [Pirellulales bacterium]